MADQTKQPQDTDSKETQEQRDDMQKMAENAKDALIKAHSMFPFVLFPDTISVSRMKVAITKRMFFRVAEVVSIQHQDILNVEVDVGPIFGSLKIYTNIYGSKPLRITFLSRHDAIAVKRIIEGFNIAHKQKIETSGLERDELLQLVKRLGSDAPLT